MALKPPAWCAHAVPTRRGWVDPHTGELLKAQRISDVDLQETRDVVEQVVHAAPQMLNEAPANRKSLEDMTDVELDVVEEQTGVEVTTTTPKKKKKRKPKMIKRIRDNVDII